ncbi:MAG: hypothetical protein BroJett040_25130 [Oligoflexia bacterium]|nr:MAG: hypothetical protein BroJett040_25130 [Oligoflexia bacterium]
MQSKLASTEENVRESLKAVIDPEIGVNIVDLGLIYQIQIQGRQVTIDMTMTSQACPMSEQIISDVEQTLRTSIEDLDQVQVNLVFEPPWSPEKMSPEARQALGWGES